MKRVRLLAFILLTIPFQQIMGQGSIDFRSTPNVSAKPEIVNPSPANIFCLSIKSHLRYIGGSAKPNVNIKVIKDIRSLIPEMPSSIRIKADQS